LTCLVFGDFRAVGQAQWLELHDEIKHFFFRAAKQAGITSVSTEKRADLATSMRRPGDIKIGSTRHGWKAASGKTLLIDFSTNSSVCATWVTLSAAVSGGGGKGAAAEKTRVVLNSPATASLLSSLDTCGVMTSCGCSSKAGRRWCRANQPHVAPVS